MSIQNNDDDEARGERCAILYDCFVLTIMRNEERNEMGGIAEFVRRVAPHCGRALLLDTGSDDGTVAAAQRAAPPHVLVRSVPRATPFSFAAARNETLRAARAWLAAAAAAAAAGVVAEPSAPTALRYFLVLDADECLERAQMERLRAALDAADAATFLASNLTFKM